MSTSLLGFVELQVLVDEDELAALAGALSTSRALSWRMAYSRVVLITNSTGITPLEGSGGGLIAFTCSPAMAWGAGLDGLFQHLGGAALALAPGLEDEAAEGAVGGAGAIRAGAVEQEVHGDLIGFAGDLANLVGVGLHVVEGDVGVGLGDVEDQAQIFRRRQLRGRAHEQEVAGGEDHRAEHDDPGAVVHHPVQVPLVHAAQGFKALIQPVFQLVVVAAGVALEHLGGTSSATG